MNINKLEIICLALENLQTGTGIRGHFDPLETGVSDGKLTLTIDNQMIVLNAMVKAEWRNHHLQVLKKLNDDAPLLVVATSLFPKVKEELRHLGIGYLEANGNFFLKRKGVHFWIEQARPLKAIKTVTGRAFTKTGLKVVFQFLVDNRWVSMPYRLIAEQLHTGIGNITNIMKGLKQEGFLLPVRKGEYQLHNTPVLMSKWMEAYALRLQPALKLGTFRFLREDDFKQWKKLPLKKNADWWGGEPAADLMTGYLRPAELTVYTKQTRNELIKQLKLIPDENGNVKIFQAFWSTTQNDQLTVPPLLVYADLMSTGDQRCVETAQKIYDERMANKF